MLFLAGSTHPLLFDKDRDSLSVSLLELYKSAIDLCKSAKEIHISLEEIHISLADLHISLREICISFPDLHISLEETPESRLRRRRSLLVESRVAEVFDRAALDQGDGKDRQGRGRVFSRDLSDE